MPPVRWPAFLPAMGAIIARLALQCQALQIIYAMNNPPKKTHELLIDLLNANPALTGQEAADLLGISRQRVQQIVKKFGVQITDGRTKSAIKAVRYASHPEAHDKVPKTHVGGANELLVAAYLLARGIPTYRSLTVSSRCDLIADICGKFVGIEVKTAYKNAKGHLFYGPIDKDRFDVLALVDPSGAITFRPNDGVMWPLKSAPDHRI